MEQERLALLALRLIPGVGDKLFRELIGQTGSATEVFRLPTSRLTRINGIGSHTAKAIRTSKTIQEAENQFKKAEQHLTRILFFTEPAYPERLKNVPDAPTVLFVKGNINLNKPKIIAVVGTRKSTSYGRALTHELIQGLKKYDPVIVSGLAYGIDIQAHTSCLQTGIPTIGILGSGLDIIYPSNHKSTASKMTNSGAIISEQPFGTGPDAHHFPARNRIIAGLSDAIVVVEAGEKGGALITSDIMNSYNRDVFAFPGSVFNPWSVGCNQLIRNHQAQLITGADDLASMMNWDSPTEVLTDQNKVPGDIQHQDGISGSILTAISLRKTATMDELQFITGLNSNILSSRLLMLELEGRINAMPGNLYCLSDGRTQNVLRFS